jgi:hypothetical protein
MGQTAVWQEDGVWHAGSRKTAGTFRRTPAEMKAEYEAAKPGATAEFTIFEDGDSDPRDIPVRDRVMDPPPSDTRTAEQKELQRIRDKGSALTTAERDKAIQAALKNVPGLD